VPGLRRAAIRQWGPAAFFAGRGPHRPANRSSAASCARKDHVWPYARNNMPSTCGSSVGPLLGMLSHTN
jgi:hypothetical protein